MDARPSEPARLLATFACALASLPCVLQPLQNPDLYWHLSAGRWIWENAALPGSDFLSHTMQGKPWLDFEWLTQLQYWALYRLGGFPALFALRLAFFAAIGAVLYRRLSPSGPASAALGVCWAAAALLPMLDLRADNVSLLFFSLILWALESARSGRLKPGRGWTLAASALFALWSNLHLGLAYGLLAIGVYGAADAAQARLSRPRRPLAFARLCAAWAAAGALGSLCNPFGARLYRVLFEHMRSLPQLAESICEWQPPKLQSPYLWPYAALLLLAFSALLLHQWRRRGTPWSWIAVCGYFALASASHQRHWPYFVLAALPVSWACAKELSAELSARARTAAILFGACAALAFALVFALPHSPLSGRAPWRAEPTRGLADFISAETQTLAGLKLYNSWGDGGYLGFRLWPRSLVYYDGRYIFHELLKETEAAADSAKSWAALMRRHDIELALVKRSPLNPTLSSLKAKDGEALVLVVPYYESYLPRRDWALVYWNDRDLLFVRRDKAPRAWVAAREYTVLRPDHQPPAAARVALGLADAAAFARERERHLARAGY